MDADLKQESASVEKTVKSTLKKYFTWSVDKDMDAVCDKFSVAEDGTLARTKIQRTVESMKIEGYSKEFRENYVSDLEQSRSHLDFVSDDMNDHLVDLHNFVMECMKFYPLDFKVEFVQQVADMFEKIRDSKFFTEHIAQIKKTFAKDIKNDSKEIEERQ